MGGALIQLLSWLGKILMDSTHEVHSSPQSAIYSINMVSLLITKIRPKFVISRVFFSGVEKNISSEKKVKIGNDQEMAQSLQEPRWENL